MHGVMNGYKPQHILRYLFCFYSYSVKILIRYSANMVLYPILPVLIHVLNQLANLVAGIHIQVMIKIDDKLAYSLLHVFYIRATDGVNLGLFPDLL